MITAHFPYPPFSGTPLRIYNLISRSAREHEIWLASFINYSEKNEYIQHMLKFCQGVETVERQKIGALERPAEAFHYFMTGKPPELRLYHSPELIKKVEQLILKVDFDVVEIIDSFMGLYLEALPKELRKKAVLTFIDIVFSKYHRISKIEPKIQRKIRTWLYSRMMRRWEPYYAARFGRCITVSESDRRLLLSVNPHLRIDVAPNGVDSNLYKPLPYSNSSPTLIFVGNMGYRPNIDAITHFYKDIYPQIQEKVPAVEMWVVGINPSPEVKQLAGEGFHVTGAVEDLLSFYKRSTVCVVPLRAGGGTRLKILEAMALGRPVISTSIGCEGLDVIDGQHILIADTPDEFVEKTIYLLNNEGLRQSIIAKARELIVKRYDWEVINRQVLQTYSSVSI